MIEILNRDSEIPTRTEDFIYTRVRRPYGQGREKAFFNMRRKKFRDLD